MERFIESMGILDERTLVENVDLQHVSLSLYIFSRVDFEFFFVDLDKYILTTPYASILLSTHASGAPRTMATS